MTIPPPAPPPIASAAPPVAPLLDDPGTARLREAIDGYTVPAVHGLLGLAGQAALARGDAAGVRRALRGAGGHPVADLVRLFVLGDALPAAVATRALAPLPLSAALAAGLVEAPDADTVRARVDLRPYAEADGGGPPWWVVSDPGSDVRPGPLAPDHVLGVGAAATTLAQTVPRPPSGSVTARALDVGTGCGVQALHLGRHSGHVTATDLSGRALRFAATTAALSGQAWDLRRGSLLEPVDGEFFDLIVSNPPFVVSPGGPGGHDYRDSGLPGDAVCRELVHTIPGRLLPGGSAHLLANWVLTADAPWQERVTGWVDGIGCDAWFWQREVADPGEYVSLWLRDAGEVPGTERWTRHYDEWLDWFAVRGVLAVGMGMVALWRTDADVPSVVCDEVPQTLAQPVGPAVAAWHERQQWLRATAGTERLGASVLGVAPGVVRRTEEVPDGAGWAPVAAALLQPDGLRWEIEVDDAVAAFVAGCDGRRRVGELAGVLAASVGGAAGDVLSALDPVVRDLVARGLLLPADSGASDSDRAV